MIDITFTLTETEFVEAQKLYQREAIKKIVKQRWNVVALSLLNIAGAALLCEDARSSHWTPLTLTLCLPVFALVGIVCAIYNKRTFRDAYQKDAAALSHLHVILDEDGYSFRILDQTHGFVAWAAFTSWHESSSLFLLGRGSSFYPLPKSALTETNTRELRMLFATNVRTALPLPPRAV